jgi:hypothetical protein
VSTSSHTDSVPLYLTEKLSPTRRRGGGAAAGADRRLPPTLRRPPPTAADRRRPSGLAPTAHVWRRPAPNGRQMRRSACAETPPNLESSPEHSPNRNRRRNRRIGALPCMLCNMQYKLNNPSFAHSTHTAHHMHIHINQHTQTTRAPRRTDIHDNTHTPQKHAKEEAATRDARKCSTTTAKANVRPFNESGCTGPQLSELWCHRRALRRAKSRWQGAHGGSASSAMQRDARPRVSHTAKSSRFSAESRAAFRPTEIVRAGIRPCRT